MIQKVYAVLIKGSGHLCNTHELYDSFEKAKTFIFDTIEKFAECRKVQATDIKNEFIVSDLDGNYLQTLEIVDILVR